MLFHFSDSDSDPCDTRTRLLNATLDCVVCDGFAAVTTQHIAAWAQLGTGTLYRHFPTKAALLQAAFAHATALLRGGDAPDPPAVLLRDLFAELWLRAAGQAARHRPAFHYWRLFRADTPLEPGRPFPRCLSLGPFARVPHLLLEAVGPGPFRHAHAWQMAAQWTAVLQYVFFTHPSWDEEPEDAPTPRKRLDAAFAAWWNGIDVTHDAPALFGRHPEEE